MRPTTALFGWTTYPVSRDTIRELRASSWVTTPVWSPMSASRVRSSITISSSEALPARSPIPLIAHST